MAPAFLFARTPGLRLPALCAVLGLLAAARAYSAPVIPPTGRFPERVLELIQHDPDQFEFQHAWIAHTERLRQNRLRIERGELTPRDDDERRSLTVVNGTRKIPVFLGKFSDTGAGPIDADDLQQQLFDGPWPTGTMSEYYAEISYGNLTLDGTVFDWVTVSNADTFYAGQVNGLNPSVSHTGAFVREVVAANDPAVNFAAYDNDGPDNLPNSGDDDGIVDFVAIVHPETGGECGPPDNLWSQRSTLSKWDGDGGVYATNDAKFGGGFIVVDDFTIMPALSCDFPPAMTAIGVFCHEFGHAFGLPDLYDLSTNGSSCESDFSQGVGYWCLMGSGNWNTPERPAHMSVWSKSVLGWIAPTVVTNDLNNWPILSATRYPVAFKMWDQGSPGQEYFLVERRTAEGFDDEIQGPGILIWHLDETNTAGNLNECHPSIDLECADQTLPDHTLDHDDLAEGDNKGDSGDPFCDGDEFTSASTPSSDAYNGTATGVQVKDIHGCGSPTALADLLVGAAAGSNDICLRDCGSDVCGEPSPCDVFWKTPEVYIDNNDDGIVDAPAPGIENHLFARVRNIGVDNAANVDVDFYYADPHIGVNFPSQGTLIGSDQLSVIGSGSSDVADVMWTIPNPPPSVDHYCVGVVATNALDGQSSEDARADDNVAQINLQALYAKAGDNVPAGAAHPPAVVFDTTRIVTLCNNGRTTCAMTVRIGSPPLYDDAFIPSDWTVTVSPTNVILAPRQCVKITVRVRDTNAVHGDYAVIPLTGLCGAQPIGGDVLEFHIDNVPPQRPCTFTVTETPHGDHFPGTNGLAIEWDAALFDERGFAESVERWRIYRGSSAAFVPSPANLFVETCVDDDPLTARYQHFEDLPEDSLRSWYKMVAEDRAGNISDTCVTHVQRTLTGVDDAAAPAPGVLLLRNAPSPFPSSTVVHYVLPRDGAVDLAIFASNGRLVRVLASEKQSGGAHDVTWDGHDNGGRAMPSGTYYVRLTAEGRHHTSRLTLMR